MQRIKYAAYLNIILNITLNLGKLKPQSRDNRQNFNLLQHNLYEFYCVTIITHLIYNTFKLPLINAPEWNVKMVQTPRVY